MCKQLWMIAMVWAYRPMMWLVAIVAVLALVASTVEKKRTVMLSSFPLPGGSEVTGAVKQVPTSVLADSEIFRQSAESGETDASIEGIDLTGMNLLFSADSLNDFSSFEAALANYPSVEWIRFDKDQIKHVRNETISKLSQLTTITIRDNQITQADINSLAQFSRLQILVLETLDFPASLSGLSDLPRLDTLVLSHGNMSVGDSTAESLFRPEVLSQTHTLPHLRRLILMPEWLPGEAYFAGSETPDPACDSILKENAAGLLPGHPSLTDLWLGVAKYERAGKDLATVRAALPNVNVRSAQYNAASITRVGFGTIWIVLLTVVSMYNLTGHFSTPQRRVIPKYENPHMWFVFGFATLVVIVSTIALHSPVAVAWLPALAVATFSVALAATCAANTAIHRLCRSAIGWASMAIMMMLFLFQWARPILGKMVPAMEPVVDHFLTGHHPILAIIIAAACLSIAYWMIKQFSACDRLNAEAGLPPAITGRDFTKQAEMLGMQQREKLGALRARDQLAQDTWHSKLAMIKSKRAGWRRDVQLDWMGEPTMPFVHWLSFLVTATAITFVVNFFTVSGREFGAMYVCISVGIALVIPLASSLSRRDVLPVELLFARSRGQFLRRRTLSTAAKYVCLFAGLFIQVAIVQSFCFQSLSLDNTLRALIMFVFTAVAGTGLVLWGSSIRNIFAFGLLVVVGLLVFVLAVFSCLDFRLVEPGKTGAEIHALASSPVFYAASYLGAGLLLWTGYHRLSRCELALQ